MPPMDTDTQNQKGIVSSGSCYLMVEEIPGPWEVKPAITNGHAIVEYGFGASKAIVPAENGLGLESARALGTLMTLTVMKGSEPLFVDANAKGKNLAKITIINLKNHGVTADESFRVELTNVRIVDIRTNRKRQMGGHGHTGNATLSKINQERGVGWALDSGAASFAQSQDPNAQQSIADVYEMDLSYSTVTIVHTAFNIDGTTDGKTPAFFDFIHNTIEAK